MEQQTPPEDINETAFEQAPCTIRVGDVLVSAPDKIDVVCSCMEHLLSRKCVRDYLEIKKAERKLSGVSYIE